MNTDIREEHLSMSQFINILIMFVETRLINLSNADPTQNIDQFNPMNQYIAIKNAFEKNFEVHGLNSIDIDKVTNQQLINLYSISQVIQDFIIKFKDYTISKMSSMDVLTYFDNFLKYLYKTECLSNLDIFIKNYVIEHKIRFLEHHTCGGCNHPVGYEFSDNYKEVYYNSSCDCVDLYNRRLSSYSEISENRSFLFPELDIVID